MSSNRASAPIKSRSFVDYWIEELPSIARLLTLALVTFVMAFTMPRVAWYANVYSAWTKGDERELNSIAHQLQSPQSRMTLVSIR